MKSLYFIVLVLLSVLDSMGSYQSMNYETIVASLHKLASENPNLVNLTTAQARYGLPSPGRCGSEDCQQYIVRITNQNTLPDPERPEVFFSGELHGDERVGPTTLMVVMNLLVDSYNGRSASNPWLNFLVDSRVLYFMPMTNALGYYRNVRTENLVDPNRDFPIDLPSGKCMETIAARALNELWREHMFQLSLTFHGGMRAIAYEWGTTSNKYDRVSPDDFAQTVIGAGLSKYAGLFPDAQPYPHQRLNDLVYPVRGGMEDWAYAGSWSKLASPCNPHAYGGYPREKTIYANSQLRAFNILIEASKRKNPFTPTLGADAGLLNPIGTDRGHIPRNVRLALLTAELVQPYNRWINVDSCPAVGAAASNATTFEFNSEHRSPLPLLKAQPRQTLQFAWEVGGGFDVDLTYLAVAKLPSAVRITAECFPDELVKPGFGMDEAELNKLEIVRKTEIQSGKTRWSENTVLSDREQHAFVPAWKSCVESPEAPGVYVVFVVSSLDKAWANTPDKATPLLPPQSHIVNARSNLSWDMSNGGHRVKGRTKWYSKPLMLVVSNKTMSNQWTVEEVPKDAKLCSGNSLDVGTPPIDEINETLSVQIERSDTMARSVLVGIVLAALVVSVYHCCKKRTVAYSPVNH